MTYAGRHCEQCQSRFYRRPEVAIDDKRVCSPCRCRRAGVLNQTMECEQVNEKDHPVEGVNKLLLINQWLRSFHCRPEY